MKRSNFISIISALLVLLAVALSILAYNVIDVITAQETTAQNYSYTKAICENGICQDYIIECNGTKIISQTPITGAAITLPTGWEDPRPQELIEGFCNLSN